MVSETRQCQNCKREFTIEPDDFSFYERIHVPPPTRCPECRQMRRYAWRNERNLYRRKCDKCGKSTIAIYHPDAPYRVYCNQCWWSDDWDPKDFGVAVDLERPFFDQFEELMSKVPRLALLGKNSVNSEYTNHSANNKNVYFSFDTFGSEDSFYLNNCWNGVKDSCDTNLVYGGGEFLYECFQSSSCFRSEFCLFVNDGIECKYCFDCANCQNCFMSWNLRSKKYCFRNEQLSKDEYEKRLGELNFGSDEIRRKLYEEWVGIIKSKAIHKYAEILNSQNVSGDVIHNSRNIRNCFYVYDSDGVKNSIIALAKDSMDIFSVGFGNTELVYESHALTDASNTKFCNLSYENMAIEYCDSCHDSKNLFGCTGMRKGDHCILNKQYSEEEYEETRRLLIAKMTERGEYGEFFPAGLSPFGYNETHGDIYMPMTKQEALAKGFKWQDDPKVMRGKGTLPPEKIPDDVKDIEDSIAKEVLTCISCDRNYNVIPDEIEFYRRMTIPVPRLCPECRYRRRIALWPPRKLSRQSCRCDRKGHFHGEGRCPNEFESPFPPDGPEIVYCEECYQKEVL